MEAGTNGSNGESIAMLVSYRPPVEHDITCAKQRGLGEGIGYKKEK